MTLEIFEAKHIPAVAEIERLCFSEPWSEQGLTLLLNPDGLGVVCVGQDGAAVAYACMTTVLDEGEIVTVATHPEHRRCGYARLALRTLCREAAERGIVTLTLEVRESNGAARALYESEGFATVGLRRGFYSRPRENAVVMQKQNRG